MHVCCMAWCHFLLCGPDFLSTPAAFLCVMLFPQSAVQLYWPYFWRRFWLCWPFGRERLSNRCHVVVMSFSMTPRVFVTVFCLRRSFCGGTFEQQGLTYTCARIHPRRNTPENSRSLPWAVSVTPWTHNASLGPAPHRARPYIYPTLLLRVTNMGMGRREGVTQLSAHYVDWSLHSYDCICDCCPNKCLLLHLCPQPGVAECQIEIHPSLCCAL